MCFLITNVHDCLTINAIKSISLNVCSSNHLALSYSTNSLQYLLGKKKKKQHSFTIIVDMSQIKAGFTSKQTNIYIILVIAWFSLMNQ